MTNEQERDDSGRDDEPNAADLAQGVEWWARTCIWWSKRCREAWAERDDLVAEVRSSRGVVQAVREICDERELHDSWRRNFDGSWASHPVLEVPEVRAALAAAADAPQSQAELSLSCEFGEHDKCPNGCDCDCHFGPVELTRIWRQELDNRMGGGNPGKDGNG